MLTRTRFLTTVLVTVSAQGNSTLYPPGWNHEAVTPPLGWRSWNAFGPNINNETFVKAIDALVAKAFGGKSLATSASGSMRAGRTAPAQSRTKASVSTTLTASQW